MPLHPLLVHFPIALWTLGTLLLLLARAKEGMQKGAWLLLGAAALSAVLAAWSGEGILSDIQQSGPRHFIHRRDGTLLPWLMAILLLARLHWRMARRSWPWAWGAGATTLISCWLWKTAFSGTAAAFLG
jgi:uncharacterized membrane protein